MKELKKTGLQIVAQQKKRWSKENLSWNEMSTEIKGEERWEEKGSEGVSPPSLSSLKPNSNFLDKKYCCQWGIDDYVRPRQYRYNYNPLKLIITAAKLRFFLLLPGLRLRGQTVLLLHCLLSFIFT